MSRASALVTAAVDTLRGRSRVPGAVVLAYHDVLTDDAPPFPYAVSLSRFRQHLGVVERLGLRVVSLQALADACRAGRDVTGQVAIVFDDALVGVHHLALPELAARGWPATLHPVVDRAGLEPPWWPGSQRTMTWRELQEAASGGVALAAHGTTHACLPCLPPTRLRGELHDAKARLDDLTGGPVLALAYPFGHHTPQVRAEAQEAGYTTGWTFLNGRVLSDVDAWRLPRLTMHQGLTAARLAWQLSRRAADWPDSSAPVVHPHEVTAG